MGCTSSTSAASATRCDNGVHEAAKHCSSSEVGDTSQVSRTSLVMDEESLFGPSTEFLSEEATSAEFDFLVTDASDTGDDLGMVSPLADSDEWLGWLSSETVTTLESAYGSKADQQDAEFVDIIDFNSATCTPSGSQEDLLWHQPLPCSMEDTRRHCKELEKFLAEVQRFPEEIHAYIEEARELADLNSALLDPDTAADDSFHAAQQGLKTCESGTPPPMTSVTACSQSAGPFSYRRRLSL